MNINIHQEITKTAVDSNNLIMHILTKYNCYSAENYELAFIALVKGSILPDSNLQKWRATAGWHGIRVGNTKMNNILKNQAIKAARLLINGEIALAFTELGMALHTLQDSTAHFTLWRQLGIRWNAHKLEYDLLTWDYRGKWVTENVEATIMGNNRAKLALELSKEYLSDFIKIPFTKNGTPKAPKYKHNSSSFKEKLK